jgi:hypothetical protein
MEVTCPIFVRERDSSEVTQYSSAAVMQNHIEQIDVENNEYEAWDADGIRLVLSVRALPQWLRIEAAGGTPEPAALADAIKQYAYTAEVQADLSPLERHDFPTALRCVRTAVADKWQSKSWWERFKSRF